MKKFKHLTYTNRLFLESALNAKMKIKDIAENLNVDLSTVYREIKKGLYEHLNSDYTSIVKYSATISQKKYEENLKAKGSDLKISNDIKLANYIEEKIMKEKYSPEAVLGEIKRKKLKFKTIISKTTLYSYIDKNIFLNITNKNLPSKKRKRKKYKSVKVQQKINIKTIELRPKKIEKREEFGHWEMDTVVGLKGVSKKSLLVLTERKTRMEIILKLDSHTSDEVVKNIDLLENSYKNNFKEIFKTITCDNGTEFSNYKQIEKSKLTETNRTTLYYCHAYSSWERGSNENQNKLIRRHIPKGTNFDDISIEEIKYIEEWINNYPRKIFRYKSSKELFEEELKKLIV